MRCDLAGVGFERRDGTFAALPHEHAGFAAPGVYSEEARRTHAIFAQRRDRLGDLMTTDGLSTMRFKLLEQRRLTIAGRDRPAITLHRVEIGEPG